MERLTPRAHDPMRIGILVVAYNAAATLVSVLDRIPIDFRGRITGILVSDDASSDTTYEVGLAYAAENLHLPLTVVRQPRNLGYGGNQKFGYRWATENDLDIVVLLHGDGQYAPELLPEIVRPIEDDEADAVMGSRMLLRGAARRGGMPLYKFVGNRILTRVENAIVGVELSEWHSGYRAYRVSSLAAMPFARNSDGFDFDTEIIVQLVESRARIREIAIPTYYGDEISHVNGMKYAFDIVRHVLTYRLHRIGFGSGHLAFATDEYEAKEDDDTSHSMIVDMVDRSERTILDLGCGPGHLAQRLRDHGHRVVGIDVVESPGVRTRTDDFEVADLGHGLPAGVDGPFDVILAGDVLEHLPEPERLLDELRSRLAPGGEIIASVPNFVHWYPRLRVLVGRFGYDRRGILDRGHLRFFTRSTFAAMAGDAGFEVTEVRPVGLPLEVRTRSGSTAADPGGRTEGPLLRLVASVDRWLARTWPSMFAYQYVFRLVPASGDDGR